MGQKKKVVIYTLLLKGCQDAVKQFYMKNKIKNVSYNVLHLSLSNIKQGED